MRKRLLPEGARKASAGGLVIGFGELCLSLSGNEDRKVFLGKEPQCRDILYKENLVSA